MSSTNPNFIRKFLSKARRHGLPETVRITDALAAPPSLCLVIGLRLFQMQNACHIELAVTEFWVSHNVHPSNVLRLTTARRRVDDNLLIVKKAYIGGAGLKAPRPASLQMRPGRAAALRGLTDAIRQDGMCLSHHGASK